jgi:hypothetical protein
MSRPRHKPTEQGWAPPTRQTPIVMPDELYSGAEGATIYLDHFRAWYKREGVTWMRIRDSVSV